MLGHISEIPLIILKIPLFVDVSEIIGIAINSADPGQISCLRSA